MHWFEAWTLQTLPLKTPVRTQGHMWQYSYNHHQNSLNTKVTLYITLRSMVKSQMQSASTRHIGSKLKVAAEMRSVRFKSSTVFDYYGQSCRTLWSHIVWQLQLTLLEKQTTDWMKNAASQLSNTMLCNSALPVNTAVIFTMSVMYRTFQSEQD